MAPPIVRPPTVPTVLHLRPEQIRNLPKVNKGSGGADPFVMFEVRDLEGRTLVGGPREVNCDTCKTRPLKRCLEGYPSGSFAFKVDSRMVRTGCELIVTVLDHKPPPLSSRTIGSARLPLRDLTSENGAKRQLVLALNAVGDIINTFGVRFPDGTPLLGYRDAAAPADVVLDAEFPHPEYDSVRAIPAEEQLPGWAFHLLEPEAQAEYQMELLASIASRQERARVEQARADFARRKAHRESFVRTLEQQLADPAQHRPNFLPLQEVVGSELLRREWGFTMLREGGAGGWKRAGGGGLKEERHVEAERALVLQWLRYRDQARSRPCCLQKPEPVALVAIPTLVPRDASRRPGCPPSPPPCCTEGTRRGQAREVDAEVRRFVRTKQTRTLKAMTRHLRDWADDGLPRPPARRAPPRPRTGARTG